jgi:catechol 2,3-dioxygenase-like lactoylglutathione lyase family enzyme
MITGLHALLYSRDAEAARAFLRDVLGLRFVDTGGGWLIFAGPPAELAVHPVGDEGEKHEDGGEAPEGGVELYFMCDDIKRTVADLRAKGVKVMREVEDEGYGLFTAIQIPGGSEIGLYQPRHPTALNLK